MRLQKKQEEVEFYNYMLHLENYGFNGKIPALNLNIQLDFQPIKRD